MKKNFIGALSFLLCLSLMGCAGENHQAKTEWSYDASTHWHDCQLEGHDDKFDVGSHHFDGGVITLQPTESKEGVKSFTCEDCGYVKTESIAKLPHEHVYSTDWSKNENKHWHAATCGHDVKKDEADHRFDGGTITLQPTESKEGVKTFTCEDCGYVKTESIAKLPHEHVYATDWSKDENKHWHDATCGHDVKKDEAEHNYSNWTVEVPANYGVEGREKHTCLTCGYSATRTIAALDAKENTITAKEGFATRKIYDGQPLSLSANDFVTNGNGAVSFQYKKYAETVDRYSSVAPKNAGIYSVLVTVAGTAEWKKAETVIRYVIEQKQLRANLSKAYDGNAVITGDVIGAIEGEEVSTKITMTSKDYDATVQEVELEGADKANYLLFASAVNAEIKKREISGLYFPMPSSIAPASGDVTIKRTQKITATGETIAFSITYDAAKLEANKALTLVNGKPGEGEAKIEFNEETQAINKNYSFAKTNIGKIVINSLTA